MLFNVIEHLQNEMKPSSIVKMPMNSNCHVYFVFVSTTFISIHPVTSSPFMCLLYSNCIVHCNVFSRRDFWVVESCRINRLKQYNQEGKSLVILGIFKSIIVCDSKAFSHLFKLSKLQHSITNHLSTTAFSSMFQANPGEKACLRAFL